MDILGFNPAQLKNNSNGERHNSVFQYTDSQKKNILTHHGMPTILMNGSTEEVISSSILVEVGGRPLHRLQCLIPHIENGIDGFEYVVPLLVK